MRLTAVQSWDATRIAYAGLASAPRARSVARHESRGFDWGDALKIIRKSWGWAVSAWALVQAQAASAQALADPAGSGALVNAVRWLQGTLLGTVATVVAVIAVASVGFLMLTGRINWRYGATVIVGCFILFGAASIVAGIQSTATVGN
jgi:type IV secretion system protein VirB2